MKFWFCEKCGKRITDADVTAGLAADKQAKGVYCKSCSVGVVTGQIDAITDQQLARAKASASAIPTTESAAPPPTTHGSRPKITRASSASHTPAKSTSASQSSFGAATPLPLQVSGRLSPPPKATNNNALFAVGASALFVILGIGVIMFSGAKPPKAEVEKVRSEPVAPAPPRSVASSRPHTPVESSAPSPDPLNVNRPDPEKDANAAFDTLNRTVASLDKAAQTAALEDFLKQYPENIVSARARRMLSDLKSPPPIASPAPTVPPAPAVAAAEPAKIPDAAPPESSPAPPAPKTDDALAAWTAFRFDFQSALANRQIDTVTTLLAQAEKEPKLAEHQPQLAALHPTAAWLKELDGALLQGAARLKDVEAVTLAMAHGDPLRIGRNAPFKLAEIKESVLYFTNQGLTLPVPLAGLPDESRVKLSSLGLGESSHARLVRAFGELLIAGDKKFEAAATAAHATLQKEQKTSKGESASPEDLACFQQALSDAEFVHHERAAATAWASIVKFGELKNFEEQRNALQSFKAAHGATLVAQKNAAELTILDARLALPYQGLLIFLNFTEASGATAGDDSGQKNAATLVNGPSRLPGRNSFTRALAFNGVDQFVQLPEKLFYQRTALCVSLWFKTSADGALLENQDTPLTIQPSQYSPILYIGGDGKLRGRLWQGNTDTPESPAPVNDDKWHHAALNVKDDLQTVFLDGAEVYRVNAKLDYLTMSISQLGAGYGAHWPAAARVNMFYKGELSEFRVYDHPLSESEIRLLAGKEK